MTEVRWNFPKDTIDATVYTQTKVFRSNSEQSGYASIGVIDTTDADGELVERYMDNNGSDSNFYILFFFDPVKQKDFQDFILGFHVPSPRERRIIETQIIGWVPDILKPDLTDGELFSCLQLSLNAFNVQPPEKFFTFNSFPANYEQFLVFMTRINVLMLKRDKIAIRDYSYNDLGLSVTLDRGAKMAQSIKDISEFYKDTLALVKLNFADMGVGVGTIPLPISFGGKISPGILNVLDIFQALGK